MSLVVIYDTHDRPSDSHLLSISVRVFMYREEIRRTRCRRSSEREPKDRKTAGEKMKRVGQVVPTLRQRNTVNALNVATKISTVDYEDSRLRHQRGVIVNFSSFLGNYCCFFWIFVHLRLLSVDQPVDKSCIQIQLLMILIIKCLRVLSLILYDLRQYVVYQVKRPVSIVEREKEKKEERKWKESEQDERSFFKREWFLASHPPLSSIVVRCTVDCKFSFLPRVIITKIRMTESESSEKVLGSQL